MQQLETIQKTIEPLQDAILRLALLASTTTAENTLGELNNSLTELRKSDKELRDRLFVVQVAHRYDWDAANKVARRKAGEYDDPELTKVLEEREKKEEKAKREREKERSRSLTPSHAKRGRFYNEHPGGYYGRGNYQSHNSPAASTYNQTQRREGFGRSNSFGTRQYKDEEKCNNCHQKGHFWRNCPSKK